MSSSERDLPNEDEPTAKKAKVDGDVSVSSASALSLPATQPVVLNPADCNLDFEIGGNGLQGSALCDNGFAYCWSGARANFGVKGGKYCFGCKIVSKQPVDMEDTDPDEQHLCRLGISRGDDAVGNLGESSQSFGYGGTGKFANAGKFSNYGEKFGTGDTIVCAVDLENKPLASIGFSKNGKWLGTAFQFNAGPLGLSVVDSPAKDLMWESALFPHVLLKNVVVKLQFSIEDGLIPEQGFKPWASAVDDGKAILGPPLSDPRECEVMMMVGLPASGKSTWAEKWVKHHPEKRYVLLGTNLVLDQMKVPGLLRKQNYAERFNRLMDRATAIFNTLLSRAAGTPRNYIIDQTNVYKSARRRKLKAFSFYGKIAVVVFPSPEELKNRSDKRFREMGKEVPVEAVNEMLGNFVLPKSKDMPGSDEYFDEVIFVELNQFESERYLDQMKHALLSAPSNLAPNRRENPLQSYVGLNERAYVGAEQMHCAPFPAGNHVLPSQVHAASQLPGFHGITSSTPGAYFSNQRLPAPASVLTLPHAYPNFDGNYGVTPRSSSDPYWYAGVGSPYSSPSIDVYSPGSRPPYGTPIPRLLHRNTPSNTQYMGGNHYHPQGPRYY